MTEKGLLLVVSGPSGVGKGTICSKLMSERDNIKMSVSVTTRQPRPGETEGVSYFFRTEEEFMKMVEADAFLEYMCVFGKNHYGTPKSYVEEQRNAGYDVILEIDVKGALKVKEKCDDAVMIFVAPPDMDTLRNRLVGRGTETPESVARRFGEAIKEIGLAEQYDYIIVNDNLDKAVGQVQSVISAEHSRVINNSELINQLKGEM